MHTLLHALLTSSPQRVTPTPIRRWIDEANNLTASLTSTVDRAVLAGFHADRIAYAFAAGYQFALRTLDTSLGDDRIASLCATETKGAHPRSIETKLERDGASLYITGRKRWSTMAPDADVLLVVASRGVRSDGNNDLAVVRVNAKAPGVTIEPMPVTPFAPEIPHAQTTLDHVAVSQTDVLAGDGYRDYVKRFRGIEDVHVHAAVVGHLVRIARMATWPRESIERAFAIITALHAIGADPGDEPSTHIALAGIFEVTQIWLAANDASWSRVEPEVRERWERDRPLMNIASAARAQRTERAWERLRGATHDE